MRKIIIAGAAALAASGCATVTRGTNEAFVVETEPAGAQVETSHGHYCEATPCSMKLPRKNEFDVTITKDGYKTFTTHIVNQVAGGGAAGMAGNVLVGGIIGMGIDASSGAMLEFKPNPLHVALELDDGEAAPAERPLELEGGPEGEPVDETAPASAEEVADADGV